MLRLVIIAGAALAIASAGAVSFLLSGEEARGQTTVNVDVGDVYFCAPSFSGGICETDITVGDTVTWQWVGALLHTVTQCDPSFTTCPPAGGFDSGSSQTSGTFSHTFSTAGSFEYQCNEHFAGMRGRINVAAQATPTATAVTTSSPAQTGGNPTASPAGTQTVAPAAVPSTGGDAGGGGSSWLLLAALVGGVVLITSAGVGVGMLRQR